MGRGSTRRRAERAGVAHVDEVNSLIGRRPRGRTEEEESRLVMLRVRPDKSITIPKGLCRWGC